MIKNLKISKLSVFLILTSLLLLTFIFYSCTTTTVTPTYKVTFNTDGGSLVSFQEVNENSKATEPKDPTKEFYTFSFWYTLNEKTIPYDFSTPVTSDLALYALWERDPIYDSTYTVTWVVEDVISYVNPSALYLSTPVFVGDTPTKESTVQYDYVFNGWNPSISAVTKDITYTAVFSKQLRQYTVTFVNYDDEILQVSDYNYGETPLYSALTPTKESDSYYVYSFLSWDKEIDAVSTSVTYTAIFTASDRFYQIEFLNYDLSVLQTSSLTFNSTAEYNSPTPIKESTDEFDFVFSAWNKEITNVTDDTTYIACFDNILRNYTIEFLDYDLSVLQSGNVDYGTLPVYNGDAPTKESTDEFDFVFYGWDAQIENVTGIASYTAQYDSILRSYTIEFLDYDLSVLQTSVVDYGTLPVYSEENPTKESTDEFDFVFNGWDTQITNVTGNTTYTACYDNILRSYTIEFLDYDLSVLQTSVVDYGTLPVYNGATPTKESTVQFDFVFSGWDKQIETVSSPLLYIAQYESITRSYSIVFVNYDYNTLHVTIEEYGTIPVYAGETPTKPSTELYVYTFDSWSPEIHAVDGNQLYTATYLVSERYYAVTFLHWDGSTIFVAHFNYDYEIYYYGDVGELPVRPSDEQYDYTFIGWTPEFTRVTEDATYMATYSQTLRSFYVYFRNYNYEYLAVELVEYGATVTPPADPVRPGYIFVGWDAPLDNITCTQEIQALYEIAPLPSFHKETTVYTSYYDFSWSNLTIPPYVRKNLINNIVPKTFLIPFL